MAFGGGELNYFRGFFFAGKNTIIFDGFFLPPKLLLAIFTGHHYVAAEITLAVKINMDLFLAAREQAAENNINLFSVACSLSAKNNYFLGIPTTPIFNF
jgi:hypothetical protein